MTPPQLNRRFYLPELDGLRFFAFLLVFIHHHPLVSKVPVLSNLHTYGWIGVDLFFCLSAFLFAKLLIAEHKKTHTINLKRFYIRRFFRIWPIYFLFTTVAVSIFISSTDITSNLSLRILGLFTFTDNIFTAIYNYNPIPFVPHLWTISYEEQFYLLIPFLILLLVRVSPKMRFICFFLSMILLNLIRTYFILDEISHPAIWVLPITHFESIIFGIVLGFGGFNYLKKLCKPEILGAIGVLFFCVICCIPNITETSYWLNITYPLVGLSTTFILFSVLDSKLFRVFFSMKTLVFLGKRSYGLYLYHYIGNWIGWQLVSYLKIEDTSALIISFTCSFVVTIAISVLSYRFIETPFLKLKKNFEVIASRPI
ncbi:Peptidoglycan/LPS O-acetylase OafA/YrhL, contains acyltransferase and SGNH-hydrolase domains [Tenacibaculum sp. MAR_2009_124]|uniref:acyltransferase family protein n=1 Tax=Tenacibaculum sp. MAR_2009_124 TaxID=1250059 RepID=UPI0008987CAA|nr:acyltransferase [Tenacibaculum sp. MAR_2009_124]SEC88346.1 Peptidoglycan/LPS O-acetylase OafA/YrhL, contains acyltransferase and SGNH-hydrolase domains [Tenacibaculum sp. MAR_2009_124]